MKPLIDRALAIACALTLALATAASAYQGPSGAQLGEGAAGQNLGTGQVSPTSPPFNAKCNVIWNGASHTITSGTDDSAAFQAAINASYVVVLPYAAYCEAGNLTASDHHVIDCNGSYLFAPAGVKYVIAPTGNGPTLRHCKFVVPVGMTQMQVSSTLTASLSPGATSLTLSDASKFQKNQALLIPLASGLTWHTIVTGVAGNTVSFSDPIPSTVTGASLSGGSGWTNGEEVVFTGGWGIHATGHLTVSGGVPSAVTFDVNGLYTLAPSACAMMDPKNPVPVPPTCTLTFAGASIGATVLTSFGAVFVDQVYDATLQDLEFVEGPGLEIVNSSLTAGMSKSNTIDHIRCDAATFFCVWKGVGVSNTEFHDFVGNGYAVGASAFGAVGFHIDGDNSLGIGTTESGGNHYSAIKMLHFEEGIDDYQGQLDEFSDVVGDSNLAAGVVCFGCFNNKMPSLTGTSSGPAPTTNPGQGHGVVFAPYNGYKAINNGVATLMTSNNLCDADLSWSAADISVNLPSLSWFPSKVACGDGRAVYAKAPIIQFSTGSLNGVAGTAYFGPAGASIGDATKVIVPQAAPGAVLDVSVASNAAPGTHVITVTLYDYPSYNYNAPFALGTCSFTGSSSYGCEITTTGMTYGPGDWLVLGISDSTGTWGSLKLRGLVSGL